MANKILKSITFPGLPDKYIIPETTVDSTPTQGSNNAVSSGGVYDAIDVVEYEIFSFEGKKTVISSASEWEQGSFSINTGDETNATNRIRTKGIGLSTKVKFINATNGYKFLLLCWSASEYLGIWTGNTFNKESASGLAITSCDLRPVYNLGAKYIRVLLMRNVVSESIVPSEGVNLVYTMFENDIETVKSDIDNVEDFINSVKIEQQYGNIYNIRMDELSGRYYYRNNGLLKNGANANYGGFIIPVLPHQNYKFTMSNIIFLDENKALLVTEGGNYDLTGVTLCNSGNASFFAVTYKYSDVPTDGYVISMGNSEDYGSYSLNVFAKSPVTRFQKPFAKISGSLSDGEDFTVLGVSGVRDGQNVIAKGKFATFGEVKINFSGTNVVNYVRITTSNIVIANKLNNTITQAHGLTISNEITVLLELKRGRIYITVSSMGTMYKYNCEWDWTGSRMSNCQVISSGMAFTDMTFIVDYVSSKRTIWYFGDSYAAFNTDARLPYYMIEYDFDKNVLFNSVSGSSTLGACLALETLLTYGNPLFAICATGMNDGSDQDNSTPSTAWLTNIQRFISLCENYGIIPILCTVPTIATVNNNAKNAWIKSSGYRYIDFADSVGADGSGAWYTGMIGDDGIHPSTLGAVAQFGQLITDMPEVMGGVE